MLIIENEKFRPQIEYTFKVLGELVFEDGLPEDIKIYYGKEQPEDDEMIYIKESDFWDNYKQRNSLPKNILLSTSLVILYGTNTSPDIIASAFFMLTRYEELFVEDELDEHGRVSAKSSYAYKYKFLERPVVNEYATYIYVKISEKIPSIGKAATQKKAGILYTHDVDKYCKTRYEAVKTELKNLIRLRLSGFWGVLYHLLRRKNPADTFDFLQLHEKNKGLYYFMAESEDGKKIYDDLPQSLIARLSKDGSALGVHFDKNGFKNKDALNEELKKVTEILPEKAEHARNHFLLFDVNSTWDDLEAAGIKYDSSLAYADQLGFRAGVCSPFKVFSLTQDKELDLIEIPLTMMDVTLYGYMRLGPQKAYNLFIRYWEIIKKHNGLFVLLWHNFSFDELRWRNFYNKISNYVNRNSIRIASGKTL